jgi:hypothetical protein
MVRTRLHFMYILCITCISESNWLHFLISEVTPTKDLTADPQPSTSGYVKPTSGGELEQHQDHQDSDTSTTSSETFVVSVTIKYPLHHPIFEILQFLSQKNLPKVLISNDNEHWTTGSFVTDLPNASELDLNMNETIYMINWETPPPAAYAPGETDF